ncbi:hypothetical protein J2Z84_000453 [Agrobacterium rubi]|nr:hypothetical protein [Agrobacterium rubi]
MIVVGLLPATAKRFCMSADRENGNGFGAGNGEFDGERE